jgi:RNA polymerase sigma factor (sigma-70 family)
LGLFTKKYTDSEILHAILNGKDDKVLAYLYKEVLPLITAYITKNQGSVDEAKDIFQDAVIRFYKSVKTGAFQEKCSISTFIFGISRNLWINYTKQKSRMVSDDKIRFAQDSANLEEDLVSEEKVNVVNKLLEMLGEQCHQLLRYTVYDGLSMREVVALMGFSSEDVAKTYNYRCKQKMLKLVKERPEVMLLFER